MAGRQGEGGGAGEKAGDVVRHLGLVPKGDGTTELLSKAAAEIRDRMPAHVEFANQAARLTRARYDAFMREGFDSAQSLALAMKFFWP